MNFCQCFGENRPQEHRVIERQIKRDKKIKKREIKVLFLGKTRSGKSTLFRQLKLLICSDISERERCFLRQFVYQNIFTDIHTLVGAMVTLGIPFAGDKTKELADSICGIGVDSIKSLDQDHSTLLKMIWRDSGVQQCYGRKDEFRLGDSAKYFLDDIERISRPDYIPCIEDIIRMYMPTTGLHECTYDEGGFYMRVIDLKQGFGNRMVWFQIFEGTDAIVYVVDLSTYDQTVEGCGDMNELTEAKELLHTILVNPWFREISLVVIFFNKTDVFDSKIRNHSLNKHFPQFMGPEQDPGAAKNFIKQMFLDNYSTGEVTFHCFFTCAIDTASMKEIYKDVVKIWIK